MDIASDLLRLDWPESFVVLYRDGTSEPLLRGNGIHVTHPGDDPDGHGDFSADIRKKHPQNQKQCGRVVSFSDLAAILDDEGNELFRCL